MAQKHTQLQLVAICELRYVDHRGGILQAAAVRRWGYQGGAVPPSGQMDHCRFEQHCACAQVVQVRACWDAIACCKNIRAMMRGALASPSLSEERGWGSALATTAALSTSLRRPPPLPACRSTSSTGLYDQRFSPSLKVLQVAVRGGNEAGGVADGGRGLHSPRGALTPPPPAPSQAAGRRAVHVRPPQG